MPERAHITSLEALESFRASLIVYVSKARPTLEEVSSDVLRLRDWLQYRQRTYWENQVRRRAKELHQAQQALFSAKLTNLREVTDAEQLAVHRARRALEEAEMKLKRVKQWSRQFDSRIEPLAKQLDLLFNILTVDMPQATAYLAQAIKTLTQYAGIAPAQEASGPGQLGAPNVSHNRGAWPEETRPAQSEAGNANVLRVGVP
jgi:hypothetical protein